MTFGRKQPIYLFHKIAYLATFTRRAVIARRGRRLRLLGRFAVRRSDRRRCRSVLLYDVADDSVALAVRVDATAFVRLARTFLASGRAGRTATAARTRARLGRVRHRRRRRLIRCN